VRVEQRREARRACGDRRVERDAADALCVHRGQRAARIESVPSEPQDQTAGRADDQIVRLHGLSAVAFEDAAKPGPSAIAPASEIVPPIVCTTVDPAKSWKLTGFRFASHPSGPQAQWPMIG